MRSEERKTTKKGKWTEVGAKRAEKGGRNGQARKTAKGGAPTNRRKYILVTSERNNGRRPRGTNGLGTGPTFIRREEEVESKGGKVPSLKSTSAQLFLYTIGEDKGKKQEKSRLV